MRHRLYGQSIIWSQDFSPELLKEIFERARHYKQHPRNKVLMGKRVIMLFHEASTRTRFSFEASVDDMGGTCISTENAERHSSFAKGESLEHSIRVLSSYGDAIVLRHSNDDAAMIARDMLQSENIWVPIINAGCGGIRGQHPSQSGLDWFTIEDELGRTDNLNILVAGDLKHGRTVRSLIYLAGKYPGNSVCGVSSPHLALGRDMIAYTYRHDVKYIQSADLREYISWADVVYMTRVQKERFEDPEEYERVRHACRLTLELAQKMKPGAIIMHPLPIDADNGEIETAIERLPQAAFFRQSDNGVPIRKALLEMVLGE
ncbi:MAG: aspartate carbamoyltransferase [Candidatus Adlerbacteria bacterium]|nr:aspartate carbamoyltransferase [Candidatus Adlerbacteria bacterium]